MKSPTAVHRIMFFAVASLFGSPPAVININPAIIIIKGANATATQKNKIDNGVYQIFKKSASIGLSIPPLPPVLPTPPTPSSPEPLPPSSPVPDSFAAHFPSTHFQEEHSGLP